MTIRTTFWDSAEHLNTDEEIQAYLEACLEEAGDDPALLLQGLGVIARAKNMSQLARNTGRSEEHTSELQSRPHLVCRLLLEKKKKTTNTYQTQTQTATIHQTLKV